MFEGIGTTFGDYCSVLKCTSRLFGVTHSAFEEYPQCVGKVPATCLDLPGCIWWVAQCV